jgi:hypothetical protein
MIYFEIIPHAAGSHALIAATPGIPGLRPMRAVVGGDGFEPPTLSV